MIAIRHFSALLFAWLIAGLAMAGPISESDFHSSVVSIYSFEPHKLKQPEMNAKSEQLNQFWSSAKANAVSTLPLLRKELEDPSQSAFFYYDGSKLLLSLSEQRADQALALRSIPKADLQGIQRTDYLRTVQWFASKGFDTREAALRILAFPDFMAIIPLHALTLGQNYSLIYMLFAMDESLFVPDLSSRLLVESNVESQKSLLLALWYAAIPAGNAAIKNFVDVQSNPSAAKDYAIALLERKVPALLSISFSSAQSLREERRKVMQRPISDESLMEFDKLTLKLQGKQ